METVADVAVRVAKADLADRKTFIGGSDAPIILGLSTFKTPMQLYMEKTGQVEQENLDEFEHIMAGKLMEDSIADLFSWKYGVKLRRVNERKQRSDVGFPMVAQIDRKLEGEQVVVEIKNTSEFMAKQWGEEGSDDIPIYYYAQVQHQLAVKGYKVGWVGPLIGGNKIGKYVIARNDEFIGLMIKAEKMFWDACQTRTPPEPMSPQEATQRWSRTAALPVYGNLEHGIKAARYEAINAQIKALEAEQDAVKLELQKVLQDIGDTLMVNGVPVCSWKSQITNRLDQKTLAAELPEISAKYIRPSESRVFRVLKGAKDFA